MTFEHDAVIVALAARASAQVKSGLAALTAGRLLESQVFLNAAAATMQSLVVLLETPQPAKPPMRKLAVVGSYYPPNWPKCHCGLPTLDGHLTCGNVECNESGARGGDGAA
jgi:hypothetical protein